MVGDGTTVYKFGQKVRPDPQIPEPVKLTDRYPEAEYDTLTCLGGPRS
jgi:hypothetical protein